MGSMIAIISEKKKKGLHLKRLQESDRLFKGFNTKTEPTKTSTALIDNGSKSENALSI